MTPVETENSSAEKPIHYPLTWRRGAAIILAASLLGVLLSLAVLALVNRSLRYALPSDVDTLNARVDALESRLKAAEQENAVLKERILVLEDLAERTTKLELFALRIQGEIDKRVDQAEELKKNITVIQDSLGNMITQHNGIQTFINSLRETWERVFPGTPRALTWRLYRWPKRLPTPSLNRPMMKNHRMRELNPP